MSRFVVSVRAAILAAIVFATQAIFALDTTISNEFWCTWNYSNPSPAVSQMAFDDAFDSVLVFCGPYAPGVSETILGLTWTVHQSRAVQTFNSFTPMGVMLFVK